MSSYVVIMAFLIASSGVTDSLAAPQTAKDKNRLVGPVHRVITTLPGQVWSDTYDPAGNLISVEVADAHEQSSMRYEFTYDPQGRLEQEAGLDSTGAQLYRKVFAYAQDTQGRTTGEVAASADGNFHHAEFSTYDAHGNLAETLLIDGSKASRNVFDALGRLLYSGRLHEGQLSSELIYRYDSAGRLSEWIGFDSLGAIKGRLVNEYDETGRRTKAVTEKLGEKGSTTWTATYEYDAAGNWIKEWITQASGTSTELPPAPTRLAQERVIEYYTTP